MRLAPDDIYAQTKNGPMTKGEYDRIYEEADAARARGDKDEYLRLAMQIPMEPRVAMAWKQTYGKEWFMDSGFDLTEANLYWGEGWLDDADDEKRIARKRAEEDRKNLPRKKAWEERKKRALQKKWDVV